MSKEMKQILVTGAVGQIGSELTMALRKRYGGENVVATGHRTRPNAALQDSGPFEFIDVSKRKTIEEVVRKYNIDTIYHLAAILSAVGEEKPLLAWDVNMNGLYNVLEVAREHEMVRLFCPSSIAVFGPETPRDNTPQETILCPSTMYGVTKVAGELLCDYYFERFGLDVRGLRYPGIISAETLPGGGTTDYAVDMYVKAVAGEDYTCFVTQETTLPFLYMPDALNALLELATADESKLIHRTFNVTGFSASAAEFAESVSRRIPGFSCGFEPDFRQIIAESWPRSIDDNDARREWGWKPSFDLEAMSDDMIARLKDKSVTIDTETA